MFKFVKVLGKLVVKLYFREAKALDKLSKLEAKASVKLAEKADKAFQASVRANNEAAKVAAQAQSISKFFE